MTAVHTAALISLAAWVWMLALHGGFWRADQRPPKRAAARAAWPAVAAVIPARNEAAVIARAVQSLLDQNYPGALSVTVVDDGSTDGTAGCVPADPRVTVISAAPLPAGWTGKVAAMNQGAAQNARAGGAPDYFLFTDADILHGPNILSRLAAKAEDENLALVSLMARLDASGFWGRLLIPAFVFFFQKLYPFPRVNNPARKTAAAAGGCMLVRARALFDAGGLEKIKGALIDDCALAALLKPHGPIWLGLADETEALSLRPYAGLAEIWNMVARTAFYQLRHSPALLAGCVVGMALLYLAGPFAAVWGAAHADGAAAGLGLAAWAVMAAAYAPVLRLYGLRPAPWAATLPLAGALYAAMTADSARRHWAGTGGAWKGRTHG